MRALKNFLLKKPLLCVFELTKSCNSRCSICSIWERASGNEMSSSEFEKVFMKIREIGVFEVFVQGGEPLLHPKIKEVLLFLNKHFDPRVITNGILLDKKMQDFLIGNNIGVTVSLDSLDKERYKKIRGVDSLDKVLRNLKDFSEKKFRNISIHCTVSGLNKDEVFKIRDYSMKNGFYFTALPYISNIGIAGKENKSSSYENKSLVEIFEKLEQLEKKDDFIASIFYGEVVDYLSGKSLGPCDALAYSIYMTEEGMIAPCIEKPPYLDLKKEPASKIFGDEKQTKIIRDCHINTPCYYGCTRGGYALRKNLFSFLTHPLATSKSVRKQLGLRRKR